MEQHLVIRPATPADAGDVATLTVQLGYELSATDAAARLSRILSHSDHRFWVADVRDDVVGWVHAVVTEYIDTEPFMVVAGLVVDRQHRRHGVGEALMGQVEAWARECGCAVVRLSSSDMRVDAHRFYERLGYVNIKTQYSFLKALDADTGTHIRGFVPRVER